MTNTPSSGKTEVWIGLAHVKPREGNDALEGAIGAFVPVLALAAGVEEFVSRATTFLSGLRFDVIEMDDIQLFNERLRAKKVQKAVRKLAKRLTAAEPVVMDTFQAYDKT